MDLRYVETFYRAAMLGSIAAAAAELHVVPRAASQRIRRLEIDLKATLLDRNSGKRLRLTPAGMRFFHEAERLLCLWGEIKAEMGKSVAFLRPLRVGAIESVLHSWLVPWVQTLRREKPALRFELTVETTPGLLDLMRRGMLDVVFSTDELRADGVRVRAMAPMPMVFAGGEAARRRGNYTLEQLVKLELLTFQRNSRPHTALLERLRAAGLERACVHAVSSISAMTHLAAQSSSGSAAARGCTPCAVRASSMRCRSMQAG
jgi:DNA-binding transcriptional LysR family regulator